MRIDRWLIVLGLLAALLIAGTVIAAPLALDVTWWTVDGGGAAGSSASAGGVYALEGSIGQPDAGYMEGGQFGLSGGFWPQQAGFPKLYLPFMAKSYVSP